MTFAPADAHGKNLVQERPLAVKDRDRHSIVRTPQPRRATSFVSDVEAVIARGEDALQEFSAPNLSCEERPTLHHPAVVLLIAQ